MDPTPIPVPYGGVTDASTFKGQPGYATDPDGLLNVVPGDAATGREQLATRPGLALEFGAAAGLGRVNGIGSIARASGVTGTNVANVVRNTAGSTRPSGAFRGQAVVLEPDRSVRLVLDDQRGTGFSSPPSGAGGYGAFQACWHATDADIGYFATVARDTTHTTQDKIVVGVNRFSLATNTITHQGYCADAAPGYTPPLPSPTPAQLDLLANQILQSGPYLFVAVQRYVYTFKAADLTYLSRTLIDWCEEVQGIAAVTVNGAAYLLTLTTGTLPVSGPVVEDPSAVKEVFGEFYRSAIQVHAIQYGTGPGTDGNPLPIGVGGVALIRRAMPMGLQSADTGYEDHRGFRFSEFSFARPRGCLPYAFAANVDSDGRVYAYVARTNQGWGYDGTQTNQRPDGRGPFISCCRVNLTRAFEFPMPAYVDPANPVRYGLSEAVGGWERDIDSLLRPYTWNGNTWQNDIPARDGTGLRDPHAADNEPTLWAVAINADASLVVMAGRRPDLSGPGSNVYAFDPVTGDLLWEADVAGIVQQHGVCFDPLTGNVLVAMTRSAGWTNPDGSISADKAEVLELGALDGFTVRSFDLTDQINTNGYITPALGGVGAYAVACNARGQAIVGLAPYRIDS